MTEPAWRRDEPESEPEAGRRGGQAYAHAGAVPGVQPYAIDWGRLLLAGFVGTLVITFLMYLLPPQLDVATALGTFLVAQPGPAAFWTGMLWHFVNGTILFPALYAGALLGMRRQSDWASGLAFGAVVWLLVAMLLLPAMMSGHPLVQAGQMRNPGFFFMNLGQGIAPALWSLVNHLIYGVIVGAMYRHVQRAFRR